MFVEAAIIGALKRLLAGRVNEVLEAAEFPIPSVEFGGYSVGSAVVPVIVLSACERTEKERIIRMDAYSVTVVFHVPESPEGELQCYAYAAAVDKALGEDPALGGAVSRAVLAGKKYVPPKREHCGDGWEVILSLRVTVEGMGK
jgi:hypothetical protein